MSKEQQKFFDNLLLYFSHFFHIFTGFFGCIIQNTYCTTASTDSDKRIECFACGLPMIDPTKDNSTFSLDPYEPKSKIYNESCTIYKQYQLEYPEYMNKWVRKCPAGSTNCFWAKGTLNVEGIYLVSLITT